MLWLLRHGEASDKGEGPDAERELTAKGREQSRAAGRAMARLGVALDACYASPKVRARDTARLAVEALGVEVIEDETLAEDFDASAARALVAGHSGDVLAVGHDPDFTQVVYDLTGARVDFKKGGVAVVDLAAPGELIALLRPADLAAISQKGPSLL